MAIGDEKTSLGRTDDGGPRRFVIVMAAVATTSVLGVGLAEWINPPFLAEDFWTSGGAAPWVATVGIALLLADVFLPVPSNVVMIFLGGVVGFPAGAVLSWLATAVSALLGFWIGRRLSPRVRPPERLERRLRSHGTLVVAVTRPLPVLAETTAIAAGMVPSLTWRRMAVGALAGTAPPAVLFAAAGAFAHGSVGVLLIGACLVLDGVVWYAERRYRRSSGSARTR